MKGAQTETVRLALLGAAVIAAVALLGGGVWSAYRWAYNRGVSAEAARWSAAQAKADKEQRAREDAAQAAGEAISDRTRTETARAATAITTETQESVERIEYVYLQNPSAAASCRPDGGPAPIPDGVQKELRQAERAAEAAARGL